MDLDTALTNLQSSLATIQTARQNAEAAVSAFREFEDATSAKLASLLRAAGARHINADAVKATIQKPYILIPTGKANEWWNIQSRILDQPTIGWLEQQTPAFNVYRVTRTMLQLTTDTPAWMREEMGIQPPAHAATVSSESNAVTLTRGDETSFKRKYGAYLGTKNPDGTFKLKGGADTWLRLVASMVADGMYPWQMRPVTKEYWDAKAKDPINPNPEAEGKLIVLKDYQDFALAEFLKTGVGTVTYPMGAGKSFIALWIITHFKGRILLPVEGTFALEHWQNLLDKSVPWAKDRVTLTTYQSLHKYAKEKYDLLLGDEVHRIPAPTYSRIAFADIPYRLGFSGTPWHEKFQELIFALFGPPIHLPWAQFIRENVIQRVPVIMDVVSDDAHKVRIVKQLLGQRKPGRALIYADWIADGQALADELGVPFIYGETGDKLETIKANDVCVLSRVGDSTLDLRDLSLVINYKFQQNARRGTAQRYGRTSHSQRAGSEFHILFTTEDLKKEPRALWGIQSNLAGVVETEVRDWTNKVVPYGDKLGMTVNATPNGHSAPRALRSPAPRPSVSKQRVSSKPQSEMDALLSVPAVAKLLADTYALIKDKQIRKERTVEAVTELAWDTPVSLDELSAVKSDKTLARYKRAMAAGETTGLFLKVGGGVLVNKKKIEKLGELSQRFKR